MTERLLWKRLRAGLAPYLQVQRIEDRYSKGVPDFMFAGPRHAGGEDLGRDVVAGQPGTFGLVELKFLRAWPKRDTTPVRLPEWKPEQVAWFRLFGPLAERVFLFLQVDRDYMLFRWREAVQLQEPKTHDEMMILARRYWHGTVECIDLARELLLPIHFLRPAD